MTNAATILVVEDDPKNQKIIHEIFAQRYTIVAAHSGEEALERLPSIQADIVLLDLMLPGIDGYEVCRQIKADPQHSSTPVVILSARTSLEDRLSGYEAGADDYLTKPFDHDELVTKLEKLLALRKELQSLNQQAHTASSIAMQAMTTSSELGQILQYIQASFAINDFNGLLKETLALTSRFDLRACIRIHGQNLAKPLVACDNGVVSPLEEAILDQAASKGRIFDFRHRTIINYPNISLLIKNMPLDNPERYGLIKDNICFLMEAAQARIEQMFMEQQNVRQQQSIMEILTQTTRFMDNMNQNFQNLASEQAKIIDQMMSELEDLIPRLGLVENQEQALMAITQNTIGQTTTLFNEGLRLNEDFSQTLKQLQQVCNTKGINNQIFTNILNKLSSC